MSLKTAEEFKHADITGNVIGCAMAVHNFLGSGFQEVIYQRALEIEFQKVGFSYARETEMDIIYKDVDQPIGTRRVDFLVENKVLVELKALILLEDIHKAQMLNYLEAYKLEVGLLINFGGKSLQFKRFVLSHKKPL